MVCQNQSIDDSDAPLARDLRVLVRERLKAGDSDTQVLDFLIARYGQFVLLKPRFGWDTALLWLAPRRRVAGRRACDRRVAAPPADAAGATAPLTDAKPAASTSLPDITTAAETRALGAGSARRSRRRTASAVGLRCFSKIIEIIAIQALISHDYQRLMPPPRRGKAAITHLLSNDGAGAPDPHGLRTETVDESERQPDRKRASCRCGGSRCWPPPSPASPSAASWWRPTLSPYAPIGAGAESVAGGAAGRAAGRLCRHRREGEARGDFGPRQDADRRAVVGFRRREAVPQGLADGEVLQALRHA